MLKTLNKYFEAYKKHKKESERNLKELIWANVYHDSIRGKIWLENQALNVGRWAGNYAFFYLMNRILSDAKPKSILEFGLGESTKFISCFLKNELKKTKHLVIEDDENWIKLFNSNFKVNSQTKIKHIASENVVVNGFSTKSYKDLLSYVEADYDLYVIDGPHGSPNYSRYNIVEIVKKFEANKEFIIVLDDYNRSGEKETVKEIITNLASQGIQYEITVLKGVVDVALIVSKKYSFLKTV
ncbi:hypothetical protein VOI54_09950 [Tamlana sp. 2201CG12-4]|uniref:hypothetical protein n=1 Tax=Tamlana sp. 2201CG12-4 TaxID=3112582 RepID=UPI002DB6D8B2|nr:hypothetical protein [Tamlana sp. 2201CG12-4]MEC3907340.1 hypothetical protein [Tamlana sp. 2201CG12-4]